DKVNYSAVYHYKIKLLKKAYQTFQKRKILEKEFTVFCNKEKSWLRDYALFKVLKEQNKGTWWAAWDKKFRYRDGRALSNFEEVNQERFLEIQFHQFLFFRQWERLRAYCRRRDVRIIGDIPIYVNYDSADTWSSPDVFKLNSRKKPAVVAGVPPDYFSQDGQRWGNPVYDWKQLHRDKFSWWTRRFRHNLDLYDMLRIDHFRAFVNYWEIPARAKSAKKGYFVDVPTKAFFSTIRQRFKKLPVIAEDLGMISDDVRKVIDSLGFPGMKILQFAFGGDLETHMYLPHNYKPNCVVYTGTHDNNTTQGWWTTEASAYEQDNVKRYIGRDIPLKQVSPVFIEMALNSKAVLSLIPLQDILQLGNEARMNCPGIKDGNWQWRYRSRALTAKMAEELKSQTVRAKR
ncbi:MAG: 4-alpha-glucanotransferase, partial [Candidatus Omnitrophica bacterium]|nr:4-alpha-glucanotransferase [Candidatus Omnitrophota bacterium]